ncbi:MAG: type 2 isopentenyl-diphosphate Delta-isomerase [Candidatus Altiarchaeales archaeon ex4484_2]|nr:MAG: type 2 isopentenyl-diphosphate Delta-isomerase [Candidatus Altiarchaeales archaeon ex4484_2]
MIKKRKIDHLRICIEKDVESGDAGFGGYRLLYRELPEVDFDEIDTSTSFLGKKLSYPFIIEAMTGGSSEGGEINKSMAEIAQKHGLAFGVGSQRAALEDSSLEETFQVRDVAPNIYLIANMGAVQLNHGYGLKECRKVVKMIDADALALHVNPLQEAIQPEGDRNFKDLIEKINKIASKLDKPVIVKSVGSGLTLPVAEKLKVSAFDVGGVGGTSWSIIEGCRLGEKALEVSESFKSFGVPTTECIVNLSKTGRPLIASGGVRNGVDVAKSLALGAKVAGMALPLLRVYHREGGDGVLEYLDRIFMELRISMFLTGSSTIKELDGKIELLG